MTGSIIECEINFLSFERACELVPPEFLPAYEWFSQQEGTHIPRLPRGDDAPSLSVDIKLAAMRGIHSPNYRELASRGAGKTKYALSVYSAAPKRRSSLNTLYDDQELIIRDDKTWTIEYCEQKAVEGRLKTDRSNDHLMNNLVDGVPVAVMIGVPEGGYVIEGLAYVERYDPNTGMFTLHGPVSAEADGVNFYSETAMQDLTSSELKALKEADLLDERARRTAEVIRREKQFEFRKMLLSAYRGQCAATKTSVPEVLQAAHIDPYRGKKSQVVTNGMLLRADLHLLYDSHLMTVLPDSFEIVVSEVVKEHLYRELDGKRITAPSNASERPSEYLLDLHAREFKSIQKLLA